MKPLPDLICGLSASRRLSSSHYCLFIVPKRDLLNQGLRR
ncbi:transposase [Escherichia coli O26:H11 str. 2011C-3274]|nr:transposase [Escherichia coli O26:H11 str. 2011C-3274]